MPAPNSVPRFTLAELSPGHAVISTANPNRDGTGAMGTVLTAGASGSLIEVIRVKATGTTTAGIVRLFKHDGTNARLWREILVTAITPSATVAAFDAELVPTGGLTVPTGWSLRASTEKAEEFVVSVDAGGNY